MMMLMLTLVKKCRWIVIWLPAILISVLSCSKNGEDNLNATPQQAEPKKSTEVQIGAPSKNLPPYFIYWNRKGIEQDILHEAFQKSNYKPIFFYYPKREKKFLEPKYNLDCISTVTEQLGYDGFYSDNVITYRDVAIYLKDSGLNINSKADLAGKRIEAFKDASKYLNIQDIVANSPYYHEHSGKASQILLLYRGKVKILLMDKYFFFHFRSKVGKLIDMNKEIVIRHLFPERSYKILCKDKKIRVAFNRGLTRLRTEGGYEQIIKHYTTKKDTVNDL